MSLLQTEFRPVPGKANEDIVSGLPGPYEFLGEQARSRGSAVAILAPERSPLTYAGFQAHIENVVRAMRSVGLKRNDRVAVVLPNGPEMASAFLAVAAGATCAPLNPAYRDSEFEFYLSDLKARALMIWTALDSPVREVAKRLGISVFEVVRETSDPAGIFRLSHPLDPVHQPVDYAHSNDTALVLHTSGTTSRPKIVPLTHANLSASAWHIRSTLELAPHDRCLNIMPLFHIHGLIGAVLSSFAAGASVVCSPGLAIDHFFDYVDAFQPSWYTAVPTMHQAILAYALAHPDRVRRGRLRLIRSSSAALPVKVLEDLEKTFDVRVVESYGMTEASHQMASNPLEPRPRKPGSVGIAAGPDVAVMGDDGRLLPSGETGEVVIRGPNVTLGYENNTDANKSAFVNGWFRTGDQGRFDSDGYLYLTGRLKEIINRGGEKIAPREIDESLMQHPAISQAIAFAVPHPTLGEEVAAAVVLKPGALVTEQEIIAFARGRLADFKVPQRVIVLDEIPKGPTGKLQRIGLADKLAEQLALRRVTDFVAPTTDIEKEVTGLWRSVLRVSDVGLRDNFHALGGDSLGMAVMISEVESAFHINVPIDVFLAAPTVDTIVRLVREAGSSQPPAQSSPARVSGAAAIKDSFLKGMRNRLCQILALYAPGNTSTRVWLHRMRGVFIGKNSSIGLGAIIETAYPSLVSIGDNVTIGMRAIIIGHLRDLTTEARTEHRQTVTLEDDVYVGPGVIILPNVTIGQGAVISAGSVVARSIPPRTLARGNPAVPIAHCRVSLGGGVSYEEFVRNLKPIKDVVI